MGFAVLELSDFLRQTTSKGEQHWKWQVLAEGNQMNFVIARCPLAGGADEGCGVEYRTFDIGLTGVGADGPHHHPCVGVTRKLADGIAKFVIVRKKRRRRFRPNDEINFVILSRIGGELREVTQSLLKIRGC